MGGEQPYSFFSKDVEKIYEFFLQRIFGRDFYPCVLQYFRVSKTIPALAYLVALTI